jgi:quercetin dioxygenase-like cupin family protein
MTTHKCFTTITAALCLAGLLAASGANAQATSGVKRTEVTRADVSTPNHEAVVVRAELGAGGQAGRHTHPGDEISYVVDGEGELLVDGEPARRLKPGEAFVVRAGKVHDLRNSSKTPVHLLGVYVVEKGKPLATPVK